MESPPFRGLSDSQLEQKSVEDGPFAARAIWRRFTAFVSPSGHGSAMFAFAVGSAALFDVC